jgi:hypothetical protein
VRYCSIHKSSVLASLKWRMPSHAFSPRSLHSAVPSRGVDLQQSSGSCGLPQHRNHHNDNDRASVAGSPTLPDDEENNDCELSDASPRMQLPASRDQADLQHTTSRCNVTISGMASQRDLSRVDIENR